MTEMTNKQLSDLVAKLQAENQQLRLDRSQATGAGVLNQSSGGGDERPRWQRRAWGWTLLSTVLIVIGALLAPVAIVSAWAQRELTDTDYFVSTFAPLAQQPAVQALVTDQVTSAVDNSIDIDGLTKQVFEGIAKAGLPPAAASALKGLAGPAADGIRGLIHSTVSRFVQSQAFADLWTQTLRTAHQQLGKTMSGDQDALITLGSNGAVGLQLAPVIEAVKTALVNKGFGIAKNIPTIKKTIVIAHTDSAALVQSIYGIILALGTWLPWTVLALLMAGVAVARRRALALVWAATALAISMVLVALGIDVGKTVFAASMTGTMSSAAATTIYSQLLEFVSTIVLAIAVLAITVAVIGYLAGPFRLSRQLRGLSIDAFTSLRTLGDRHGISTGTAGRWMYRQRVLLRVAVAVVAAIIILFTRPLTPALIVWTAVIAILVIAALELAQRPDPAAPR